MSKMRREEIETSQKYNEYRNKIKDIAIADIFEQNGFVTYENEGDYGLPF